MRYLKNKGLLIIITLYLFVTISFKINNIKLYTDIINPIFCSGILIYLIWNIKKNYLRLNTSKKYYIHIVMVLILNAISYMGLGIFFGFGKSPYNHQLDVILKNMLIQILPIISIEILRAVIVTRNRNNKILIVFLTILLILLEMNYKALINLFSNREEFFKYICSVVLPIVFENVLYTYLATKGLNLFNILYRIFNAMFVLLMPILPNTDWFIIASFNILSTVIIFLLFRHKFVKKEKGVRKKKQNILGEIIYTITVILSINLVCFMIGLYMFQPITILSDSMYPQFARGDVVIFKKINDEELKQIPEGTIIVYSIEDKYIAHRIVNIKKEDDKVYYQTKGDNNNVSDLDLVQIDQIKGVYAFRVKYLGFPSIWLYEYLKQY